MKDDQEFENSTKFRICDVYVDGDVKVRGHCHITSIEIAILRLN